MNRFIKAYLATLAAFLAIDAVWIALFVSSYYEQEVGEMMRATPNALAAGIFYLFYAAGIVLLAVTPALKLGSLRSALINGAVFGGLAYGTYTITNYAVIEGWTLALVASDIAWGAFLTAVTAGIGYLVAARS